MFCFGECNEERLEEVEGFGLANGRSPAVHPKLAINIFGVSPHRVERNRQLAGNLWAA